MIVIFKFLQIVFQLTTFSLVNRVIVNMGVVTYEYVRLIYIEMKYEGRSRMEFEVAFFGLNIYNNVHRVCSVST